MSNLPPIIATMITLLTCRIICLAGYTLFLGGIWAYAGTLKQIRKNEAEDNAEVSGTISENIGSTSFLPVISFLSMLCLWFGIILLVTGSILWHQI